MGGEPVEEHDHEVAPTIARRRGARSDRPLTSLVRTTPLPVEAPLDAIADPGDEAVDHALRVEESARMHGFSRIAMLMVLLVLVQLPLLGGDPQRQVLAACALTAMFLISWWVYGETKERKPIRPLVFRVQGWGLATCMLAVEHYVGFFSPMTVVLSLGIYHLGQSADRLHAILVPLYVAFSWFAGALLSSFGFADDVGLYRVADIHSHAQWLMLTGVTTTLLAAAWLAHNARKNVRDAALSAQRALAVAHKRDAVLQEAQHQLDHALRLVVGKPGRYTGTLAGNYRLDELIGLGAMGEVYAAVHQGNGEHAAVKLLHEEVLRREDHVARFLREAELCTRFDHPNVVRVHEVGRLPSGAPYMAMARLQGATLSDVLRERGQLPLPEVIELAEAAGAGLAHAHERGVVHRDFKPHNVVAARPSGPATRMPRWTILDFGISKSIDSTGTLTGVDGVLGTPLYMSPEQARGHAIDARSDLFSLASVLYRALTGRPAFQGKDAPAIMFDVVYRMPECPSRQIEGIPADVDLVFAIALAKAPSQRFASAAELVTALRAASRGALPEAYRARGRSILLHAPWGSRGDHARV